MHQRHERIRPSCLRQVRRRMPTFVPDASGRQRRLEFNGASLLETCFDQPLQQPLTLVIKARGDTTLIDSLTPTSARFELCHGYPGAASDAPATPEVYERERQGRRRALDAPAWLHSKH